MMRSILRGYNLTDLDQAHAVRLLGSVFHGYASLELGGSFSHSAPDSAESWSRILETLDSMLANWSAPQNRDSDEVITSIGEE